MTMAMFDYIQNLQEDVRLTVEHITEAARTLLPPQFAAKPWLAMQDRGRELLVEEQSLNAYFAAYAHWHKSKLCQAFRKIPIDFFQRKFNVVDWGCGQGMGALSLYDFLEEKKLHENISELILIDPSANAVGRAALFTSKRYKNTKISYISKFFHDIKNVELCFDNELPCLHLFSNILDVYGINHQDLSEKVADTSLKDNLLVISSPCYHSGNKNIDSFLSFFSDYKLFTKELESNKSVKGYTYNISVLQLSNNFEHRIYTPNFYPPVDYKASYVCDFVQEQLPLPVNEFFAELVAFRVYAPFYVGSSVSEDYHPIFAVINNIITRGLPTKAPILMEKIFEELGYSKFTNWLGSIHFKQNNKQIDVLSLKKDYAQEDACVLYSPIGVARIQKVLVEAILANKLDFSLKEWNILIEECDVPCGAIAIRSFVELFKNITQLSADYDSFFLPKINLTIISKDINSSLHLNENVYESPRSQHLKIEFDFVVNYSSLYTDEHIREEFPETIYRVKNKNFYTIKSLKSAQSERYVYTSEPILYKPLTEHYEDFNVACLKYFLQNIFRKEDFRAGQIPILNRAVQRKSVIGLLPTGGGKSLTYQLASILQPGITIVVDPLRALMQDQYNGLLKIGIDCVSYIESEQSSAEKKRHEYNIEQSKSLFAFISPERLCMFNFRERLKNMHDMNVYFSYGVIDEVHCLSEWGHDFRFSYLHLGRILYNHVKAKNGYISLFGLTATASFDVLADVERELSGDGAFPIDEGTVVRYENSNRLELQYKIFDININSNIKGSDIYIKGLINQKKSESVPSIIKDSHIYINELLQDKNIDFIKKSFLERESIMDGELYSDVVNRDLNVVVSSDWYKQQDFYLHGGVVFCPHTKGTLGVVASPTKAGVSDILKSKINNNHVATFKGGDAVSNQHSFLASKSPLMVATKAFGMGIDKPNIRLILNMNMSSSLEGFVQEAGRAGRDRKLALACILYNRQTDFDTINYFYSNNFKGIDVEKRMMHFILSQLKTLAVDLKKSQRFYVAGFLDTLQNSSIGDEFLFTISYDLFKLEKTEFAYITKLLKLSHNLDKNDLNNYKAAIEKTIYRMSCVSIISDYTIDYAGSTFTFLAKKKGENGYFASLKTFLTRYYTEAKAASEAEKAKEYKGLCEIQKCLGYLSEFVYTQIAEKRKRAMQDIDAFCKIGIDKSKDWKVLNEELKDFIYYYFNSKYAQYDYVADSGEPFSLLVDSDKGKVSSFELLFKYMKVIEPEIYGIGTPKDNIKHLQGAVRLIRRAVTNENPMLSMLSVFCYLYLLTDNDIHKNKEILEDYKSAYLQLKKDNPYDFYAKIIEFKKKLLNLGISEELIKELEENEIVYELSFHNEWLKTFLK